MSWSETALDARRARAAVEVAAPGPFSDAGVGAWVGNVVLSVLSACMADWRGEGVEEEEVPVLATGGRKQAGILWGCQISERRITV